MLDTNETGEIAVASVFNSKLGVKALFQSGMNVGKDAMGTMTNTLILAFTGTSLNILLYFTFIYLGFMIFL